MQFRLEIYDHTFEFYGNIQTDYTPADESVGTDAEYEVYDLDIYRLMIDGCYVNDKHLISFFELMLLDLYPEELLKQEIAYREELEVERILGI